MIARGLDEPNGVAFRDGALYVAEVSRVIRFDDGSRSRSTRRPRSVVVNASFPKDRHHGWKFIAFGPDGMLYVPVGAPCNVCEPPDDRYAAILRMRPDGTGLEVFARGIRNTVGFDWDPAHRRAVVHGQWPRPARRRHPARRAEPRARAGAALRLPVPAMAKSVRDPQFGTGRDLSKFTLPEMELGPHVAALGMRFYTGTAFPAEYRDQVFIAEHGSWNRSTPIGYRISLVRLRDGHAISYETFAEGWLQGRNAWGRPVDVLVHPDGSLLVSDDSAGAVYRIAYTGR